MFFVYQQAGDVGRDDQYQPKKATITVVLKIAKSTPTDIPWPFSYQLCPRRCRQEYEMIQKIAIGCWQSTIPTTNVVGGCSGSRDMTAPGGSFLDVLGLEPSIRSVGSPQVSPGMTVPMRRLCLRMRVVHHVLFLFAPTMPRSEHPWFGELYRCAYRCWCTDWSDFRRGG